MDTNGHWKRKNSRVFTRKYVFYGENNQRELGNRQRPTGKTVCP